MTLNRVTDLRVIGVDPKQSHGPEGYRSSRRAAPDGAMASARSGGGDLGGFAESFAAAPRTVTAKAPCSSLPRHDGHLCRTSQITAVTAIPDDCLGFTDHDGRLGHPG